jgi:hypothetical protein
MAGEGKRTKRIAWATGVLLLGLALGFGSAVLSLKAHARWATVHHGPWRAFLAAGSVKADPYTRATVAIGGLLALDRSETLYFVAEEDEQGRTLRGACDYRIEGHDLPARWWSITLYAGDRFLIANPQQRFSYSGTALARASDGTYVLRISPSQKPGNWLPSGGADRLIVALDVPGATLVMEYIRARTLTQFAREEPITPRRAAALIAASAAADPAHIDLPRIVSGSCS